jgi:4-hydroxy-tetrahydrodipicolinate reductase
MGRLVEALASEYGMHVVGIVRGANADDRESWPAADVAVDFSIGEAVPATMKHLAALGTDLVIGTTGWQAAEKELRDVAARCGIGVVAAPNFAVGVNLFLALVERAGALMEPAESFGAYLHEMHHAAKRDAPSGTALAIAAALKRSGYDRSLDIASTRAGSIPGTHTLGFDAASETITLTHVARDRSAFARGALEAARWVRGKQGWFGMKDVLGL